MDANGLRFWMLADKDQWTLVAPAAEQSGAQYDKDRKSLRLASRRLLEGLSDSDADKPNAEAKLNITPQTIDSFGARAFYQEQANTVAATGALVGNVTIYTPPDGQTITDLATGYDGVLYIAVGGRVVMRDLRDRWDDVTLEAQDFNAWRLAADPSGGVWVLDRDNRKIARVQGTPLHRRPFAQYSTDTFRPCEENPDPPRMIVKAEIPEETETPVAIACSPQGRVALLTWAGANDSRLRFLDQDNEFTAHMSLAGAHYPYSLAWLSDDRVAVLLDNLKSEAPAYSVAEFAETIQPVGDLYPLRDHSGGPFLNGVSLPPHYPTSTLDKKTNTNVSGSTPLHRLSLPSFATEGEATNAMPLDSASTQTVWHRLYVEAFIPANCGIKIYLAANDDLTPPDKNQKDEWHEHRFGEMFAQETDANTPRGAWVSLPSEIPFHPGLLECPREPDRSGLFTVLIQRAGRRVRTLGGRYIHVRVELLGDGRATPEIAALRVYASRFSYLNRYLPELYRESVFGEDADEIITSTELARSTAADFLERFLDNFEGILTPLEDRIANAYLLTDPRTTAEDALEWLGSWIGVTFDPAYPPARRRRMIESAHELYRKRGTLAGLKHALDIVTGDAVQGGEIIVVEDFRLRRVFATILGADLADEDDPLMAGIVDSGNSIVGDTLFLGDEEKKEFLALFNADLPTTIGEEAAIESLFDRLAHRVTVLVHQEVEPQNLGLVRRVVELETPADVFWRVEKASHSFMVGVASLVGVDTYMGEKPRKRPVEVGRSRVGERDFIQKLASLDPRLERGRI